MPEAPEEWDNQLPPSSVLQRPCIHVQNDSRFNISQVRMAPRDKHWQKEEALLHDESYEIVEHLVAQVERNCKRCDTTGKAPSLRRRTGEEGLKLQ